METVFNTIWQVKTRRKGLRAFLIYWAILTLLTPIGCLVAAVTIFLNTLPYISFFMKAAALIIPFLLTFFGFVFIYMAMPNCTVLFRHAAIGAAFATIVLEITKLGFRLYVANSSSDAVVYGVLSVFPAFLLWIYLSWLLTIIGAVLAARAGVHAHAHGRAHA